MNLKVETKFDQDDRKMDDLARLSFKKETLLLFALPFYVYCVCLSFFCNVLVFNINSRLTSFGRCYFNNLKLIDVLILMLHNLYFYYVYNVICPFVSQVCLM